MFLTPDDEVLLGQLKGAGVLVSVQPELIDESKGVILLACADADHSADLFGHHQGVCMRHRTSPRIHFLSLNGGALLLPHGSPVRGAGRASDAGSMLVEQIETARTLKEIHTIGLYAHRPCGAARMVGVDFRQTIDLLLRARRRLHSELNPSSPFTVACFLHVAMRLGDGEGGDSGKRRTYFVDESTWRAWISRPIFSSVKERVG